MWNKIYTALVTPCLSPCDGQGALRYAVILLDIADESKEGFDELIIEVRGSTVWIHFAVRPKGNRRKIVFDVK
jgi:hypothetical protein